jgi:hypothetical protein
MLVISWVAEADTDAMVQDRTATRDGSVVEQGLWCIGSRCKDGRMTAKARTDRQAQASLSEAAQHDKQVSGTVTGSGPCV